MTTVKVNRNKVEIHTIGFFGSEGTPVVMDALQAIRYVELKNAQYLAAGANNNKGFQRYATILPYYGK